MANNEPFFTSYNVRFCAGRNAGLITMTVSDANGMTVFQALDVPLIHAAQELAGAFQRLPEFEGLAEALREAWSKHG
jgi:hypothetical protein